MANKLRVGSLVLYKLQPARVTSMSDKKIQIEVAGQSLSVRPKDVELLHAGPLASLNGLKARPGEIKTAWELLAGETTTLAELAELAFGEFTPATAWSVWAAVADGLLFSGTPEAIVAHTAVTVAEEEAARAAKAAEAAAWEAFLARAEKGEMAASDGRFLQDVVGVATGQQAQSRVLRALGQKETPEQAHALLLRLGYWNHTHNPYPLRANVPTRDPDIPLPPLPNEERRDLTHLTALAIDDAGSEDPDDAVSWDNGRLWVHVADVAALIRPGTAVDDEARARGANLYLPEGTVHMLPPGATETLALGRLDPSPALSFGLDLNATGEVVAAEIVPSWIRVTRLSYDEAEQRLHESPFADLLTIAEKAEARRRANGAIEIDLPEVRIRLDDAGQVVIKPLPALRSRALVREAMLLAGEAVGRYALRHQIPVPFTSQDAPDVEAGEAAAATTPSDHFALRRKMQRSQPSSVPGAHAGLGLGVYVQVTSPLRRYLDLVAHQQLRAHLRGEPLLDEQEMMARVGAADAVYGEVRFAERQANQHWTLVYWLQNPDWTGKGIVVERRGKRHLVLIPEVAWDGWVHLSPGVEVDTAVALTLSGVDLSALQATFQAKAT